MSGPFPSTQRDLMEITFSKLCSVGIALILGATCAFLTSQASAGLGLAAILLFPLSLIWFPDSWGERIAGRITRESPAAAISLGGWLLLLGLPALFYWMARQR